MHTLHPVRPAAPLLAYPPALARSDPLPRLDDPVRAQPPYPDRCPYHPDGASCQTLLCPILWAQGAESCRRRGNKAMAW